MLTMSRPAEKNLELRTNPIDFINEIQGATKPPLAKHQVHNKSVFTTICPMQKRKATDENAISHKSPKNMSN